MSLQKAIDILDANIPWAVQISPESTDYIRGMLHAVNILKFNNNDLTFIGNLWELSPDTQYKKNLTAWIERKNQQKNPYSVFEEWQKVAVRPHGEPMFKIPDSYKRLTLEQKQLFNDSLMDSFKVCPRTTEEGEG